VDWHAHDVLMIAQHIMWQCRIAYCPRQRTTRPAEHLADIPLPNISCSVCFRLVARELLLSLHTVESKKLG